MPGDVPFIEARALRGCAGAGSRGKGGGGRSADERKTTASAAVLYILNHSVSSFRRFAAALRAAAAGHGALSSRRTGREWHECTQLGRGLRAVHLLLSLLHSPQSLAAAAGCAISTSAYFHRSRSPKLDA